MIKCMSEWILYPRMKISSKNNACLIQLLHLSISVNPLSNELASFGRGIGL
jgi:hypothetical protein